MTQRKLTQAEILSAQRLFYSQNFAEFIAAAWSIVDPAVFKPAPHIKALADHLQAIAEGKTFDPKTGQVFNRLLINIPPGTAKSLIVGVMFPAWLWTRDPSKRIISASFSQNLATRDSRKCRLLITSPWYQRLWRISLQDDENKKTAFENTHKGAREAMAFTSMTGSRGNIVIIDDPHSVSSAKSAAERQSTVDTFLESVPNRINDPVRDIIIVVMQRLHEEDVSGAILSRPELGYCHLNIPMEWEGDNSRTIIGWSDWRTVEGELLHPERFPTHVVNRLKAAMGPYVYAGQYQQRPAPANDGFFSRDWFHRFRPFDRPEDAPTPMRFYLTSDHAPGGKGDYNVFSVWGVDNQRNLYLVDQFRKKCIMDEALGIERAPSGAVSLSALGALPLARKWQVMAWYPEMDGTWIAIRSMVRAAMLSTGVYVNISEMTLKGQGDKEGKAQAYQAFASMGKVYLPEGKVGDEALDEYASFPVGKHDDQVDAHGMIARVVGEILPGYIAPSAKKLVVDPWKTASSGAPFYGSDSCW